MAIFRKIHTQIWSDPFFSELESDKKIFYLYILTNERTRQCGIYEISKKHIAFDLGITIDKVSKLIYYFTSVGKIKFSDSTNEIAVKNWAKYNYSTSPKVVKCIESELKLVKNRVLIEYIYSIDTVLQEEQEEEQEEELVSGTPTKVDEINFDVLLTYINETFGRSFKVVNKKTKEAYKATLKQGYTKYQIMQAIQNAKNAKFHIDNNYQYCTVEYFSRPKTIDMYSQTSEVKKAFEPIKKIYD